MPDTAVAVPIEAPPLEEPQLIEQERQKAIADAKAKLAESTAEVERLKPTFGKILSGIGLNLVEGAAGGTKQALGNIARTYADIIAPETPHQPGSLKSILQLALTPTLAGAFLRGTNEPGNAESPGNILRLAGQDLESQGTEQLKAADVATEKMGGGYITGITAGLARTQGLSAPALLAAPFGIGPAAIAGGLQSFGNNLTQFRDTLMERDPQLTEQQAFDKALGPAAMTGAVTAVLTRAFGGVEKFIEEIAKRGLSGLGAKQLLKDAFKSASLELPEEALDQLNQGFVEKAYINPDKPIAEIFNEAGLAGLSGFALGGLTTGALHLPLQGLAMADRAVDASKLRRQFTPEQNAYIKQVVQQQGRPNAESPRIQPSPLSEQTQGVGQGTQEQVRLRLPAQNGLETQTGAPVEVVSEAIAQAYPPPQPKAAIFGGYQYGMPSFKIPGVRPGIMRDVSAATAQKMGYSVPTAIPTEEQWVAQGRPTGMVKTNLSPATSDTSDNWQGFQPLGWQSLVTRVTEGDRQFLERHRMHKGYDTPTDYTAYTLDLGRVRKAIETGQLDGGFANNAILLHLLKESDLHPLFPIQLSDTINLRHKGVFRQAEGLREAHVEIVLKTLDGSPLSQAEFVLTLVHELVHNAVTSKLKEVGAAHPLGLESNALYKFVQESAKGTRWEHHNALSNTSEMFSEGLSNPDFQRFLLSLGFTEKGREVNGTVYKTAFGKLMEIIRKFLGIPDFLVTPAGQTIQLVTALDQLVHTASQLEKVRRSAVPEFWENQSPQPPPGGFAASELMGPFGLSGPALLRDPAALRLAPDRNGMFSGEQLLGRLKNLLHPAEMAIYEQAGLADVLHGKVSLDFVHQWMIEHGPKVEVKIIPSGGEVPGESLRDATLSMELANLMHHLDTIRTHPVKMAGQWTANGTPLTDKPALVLSGHSNRDIEVMTRYAELKDQGVRLGRATGFDPDVYRKTTPHGGDQVVGLVRVQPRDIAGFNGKVIGKYSPQFMGNHFGPEDEDVLAFWRAHWTNVGGKKILHVFEVQSDWGQHVREYRQRFPENRDQQITGGGIPDNPLLRDSNSLALKSAIDYAVKNGADGIAISDAETAMMTEGHDLSPKVVTKLKVDGPLLAKLERRFGPSQMRLEQIPNSGLKMAYINGQSQETLREDIQAYGGVLPTEFTMEVRQAPGMRLNYDKLLPNIAQQLTGQPGRPVEMGEHHNAFWAHPDHPDGGGSGSIERNNLIFKNPDGTPKTTSTGLEFDLSRIAPKLAQTGGFPLFGNIALTTAQNLSPQNATQPGGTKQAPIVPPIEPVQMAGATAQVGHIAQQAYANRESAVAALEALAYERKQFKTARNELKRLSDLATARFLQEGVNAEEVIFPDPTAGVGIVDGQVVADGTFTDALTRGGIPHDADLVRTQQQEIFFEHSARGLNNLRDRIEVLQNAAHYYAELGAAPEEIAKINKELAKLEGQASKLGSAELDGLAVSDRAAEMTEIERERQGRMAKQQALALDPVTDFFGKQVGGYRNFAEKLEAGLKLVEAMRNETAADPAKSINDLAAALDTASKWVNIPEDIRRAVLQGQSLTIEQRASIFAALGQVFEDFDFANTRMHELLDARIPEIDKEIRELLQRIASAKVESGMGQVMLADVLSTMDGETGNTGTLKSQADTLALQQRISAINSFALALGKDLETNRALFEWLANPSTPIPIVAMGTADQNLGVYDQKTLQMILAEAKRNPAFASAVLTLIQSANSKLANLPATGLAQLEELVKTNTPESLAAAEAIAGKMAQQAKARTTLANASLRGALRQLDKLQIERQSLLEGQAMFREVASSPEFHVTREAVSNSPYGLVEQMVEQNNVENTFKPFGAEGIPSHPGLVTNSANDPATKAQWFRKRAEWYKAAQEHLDAYAAANHFHQVDPANNPAPAALGFDLPKIRGLQDAVERFVAPSFLELSLLSEHKRWKVPWLARFMNKFSWFRQHDIVSKMVGGSFGTDLRARLADFVNHFFIAQQIKDKYVDIPEKMHAALKAHPEMQMNLANYREFWNELAHMGRMFGSPAAVGVTLPRSGKVITEADMALLRRQRDYEEELRRRVTETNPTQGVRVKTATRTLIRPGAYVGDYGLPRHLSHYASSFIADVRASYLGPAVNKRPTVLSFDPTTDLGPLSTHEVVRFWNQRIDMLIDHVLDSRRTDRAMRLSGPMQVAENALAADWVMNGVPAIQSLGELVDKLVAHYPPAPGYVIKDQVIKGLNDELRQYRDAAQRIATERAERDQARHGRVQIAFSADNEYTRPAANLELPSKLYDYGALSSLEHFLTASRANHERILAYATALQRAIGDIDDRLRRLDKKEIDVKTATGAPGVTIREMQQVAGLLRKVSMDFETAYSASNPAAAQSGWWKETFGFLTSAVLALPTVGIRNITQGQYVVYLTTKAMGNSGHYLTFQRALLAMPKTLARFALTLGEGIVKRLNIYSAMMTGTNHHLFEDAIGTIAKMITGTDYLASNAKVTELGIDQRQSFLQRIRRLWQETSEFTDIEDQTNTWSVGGHKVKSLATMIPKTIRAAFDRIGVQNYDYSINAASLINAQFLEQRLMEVAERYGAAREAQNLGPFDPSNPAWQLKPSEWASFINQQENADSLAYHRLLMEGSAGPEGFQLEKALWNYYKHPTRIFTERQLDAVQRKLLSEFNASTPANRSSAAAGSAVVRNLLTLQGYTSDGLLKLVNAGFGGTRDRKWFAQTFGKLPAILMMALAALLQGYFTAAMTGLWEKKVRKRQPILPDPLDADFWSSFKRWGSGSIRLAAAQLFYIGDFILWMKDQAQGNRGFDPLGRVWPASLFQKFYTTLKGVVATYKGSVKDSVRDSAGPLMDTVRGMVPFVIEAERLFGKTLGPLKQAERIGRGEAQFNDLLPNTGGSIVSPYGPTSIVRRNLGQAVGEWFEAQQAGNTAAAAAALDKAKYEAGKLEEYHYRKYIAAGDDDATARTKAQRDVWNDYQDLNPVVAAMLGKRPTDAQLALLRKGITGERAVVFDHGIEAWKAGAMAIFNKEGTLTREEAAGARGGGGGRPIGIPGLRMRSPVAGLLRSRTGGLGGRPIGQNPARSARRRVQAFAGGSVERITRAVTHAPSSRIRRPSLAGGSRMRRPAGPRISTRRRRQPYALG